MPEWLEGVSSPIVQFSVGKIQKIAWWKIGVGMQTLDVILPNQKKITLENVEVSVPLLIPVRMNVKAQQKNSIEIDASFSEKQWVIRRLSGQIDSFHFNVHGDLHKVKNQGKLEVQTSGLKNFLGQFTEIPFWLDFLIGNHQQNFELTPQNGWLSFHGVPIVPISP